MNFGIIISYVIAGFLTLTILMVNRNVNYSNQELTTTMVKTTHARAVSEVLANDIPKIGYQQNQVIQLPDIFQKTTNEILSFRCDLDNDGDIEIITWEYDPDKTPAHAKNPHAATLTRTVEDELTGALDVTEFMVGVTGFEINYYNEYGSSSPMTHPVSSEDIKQIEINLELQSDYELNFRPESSSNNYTVTKWKKRFSPVNLRSN